MKRTTRLWIGLASLVLLSPLGLLLPDHFKAARAWGEWSPQEIAHRVGYVPRGLAKVGELWKAPMPDYAFAGWARKGVIHQGAAYIVSAVLGVASIVLVSWAIGRCLAKKGD